MLVLNLIVYPAGFIFDFFIEYYKSVLATWNPDANPIEDFANILREHKIRSEIQKKIKAEKEFEKINLPEIPSTGDKVLFGDKN